MMLAAPELRVVPATVHIPLAAVPGALTRALIVATAAHRRRALMRDFGIARPRIAVAGLNPHAGEDGLIGTRGGGVIAPAIAELRAEGSTSPGRFGRHHVPRGGAARLRRGLAMYHDQALIPLKTLAFDTGVNVTLGLPFVRTSPDHGTALAIAGTGRARPRASSPRCSWRPRWGSAERRDRHGDGACTPSTRDDAPAPPRRPAAAAARSSRSLGLSARKSLGQHFILDLNLTRRIARAAGPLEGRTVVEVGPGPGGLTRALLLEGARRVVAVERDERCLPALEAIAGALSGPARRALADALAVTGGR